MYNDEIMFPLSTCTCTAEYAHPSEFLKEKKNEGKD